MLPTEYIGATFRYGSATLVLHRADGDSVTISVPPAMTINDVKELVKDSYEDLPLEVECGTVFGLLVRGSKV